MNTRWLASFALMCILAMCALGGCTQPRMTTNMDAAPRLHVDARHFQLANGMHVVLHQDMSMPLVHLNLSYAAGAADDPRGKEGLAHLAEHLMFDGSKHLAPNEYWTRLHALGTSNAGASTGLDHTTFEVSLPSYALDQGLWLESERMLSRLDHVTEAELQREKNVVLAERHQRYDNAPGGAAAEAIMGALFPEGHPYHDAGAGSARSIGEITLADAQAFARVRYAPNNATLVIAGSFEPRVAEGLVDRRFGDMPRVDLPPALTAPPVTLDHERRIELAADVGTDMLLVVWPLPRAGSDALPPASVLSEYLELLPETSRIERRRVWVAEQRLASMLIVSMALSFDTPPARVLERLDRHLSEVASENRDLVAQQFAQARTRASSSVYFGLDRLDARAAALGWGVRLFGDLEETEKRVPALLAVTAEDAQDVVRTFLPPEGRVIVTIHATPGATRRGEIMP